jgi:hypothetical protein
MDCELKSADEIIDRKNVVERMIKRLSFAFLLLLSATLLQAQGRNVEMADTLRSNGKIYVVVAVVLTIFLGIIFYLIRLDRKIAKLENNHYSS